MAACNAKVLHLSDYHEDTGGGGRAVLRHLNHCIHCFTHSSNTGFIAFPALRQSVRRSWDREESSGLFDECVYNTHSLSPHRVISLIHTVATLTGRHGPSRRSVSWILCDDRQGHCLAYHSSALSTDGHGWSGGSGTGRQGTRRDS